MQKKEDRVDLAHIQTSMVFYDYNKGKIMPFPKEFRDYLKNGAIEIVMPDLIWTGGITETKKISTLAETEQLPVAPHDMTGPVNIFACAHISMNIPNALIMETCRAFYNQNGWYNKIIDQMVSLYEKT